MKSTDTHSIRRIIVALHRDLGFFFSGVIIIYALSGIMMNHRDSINPNYSVEIKEFKLADDFPTAPNDISNADIEGVAHQAGQNAVIIKHYISKGNLKILFKGGSNISVDLKHRTATHEHIRRRPIISDMVRLHYNPGSWWACFSDIFAVSLMVITITGLFIIKGKKGIKGRGGILLLVGILIPIIFLFL